MGLFNNNESNETKQFLQDVMQSMQEENRRLRKELGEEREKVRRLEARYEQYYTFVAHTYLIPDQYDMVDITLPGDFDFWVTKLVKSGEHFAFRIFDSDNDRNRSWSNDMLDCEVGAGSAGSPFILPRPVFIPHNAKISVNFHNNMMKDNDVSVALVGYKSYWVEDLIST